MIRFKEVGQLGLRVSDLERSVDFYSNILGLNVYERPRPGLALLGCRDGRTDLALMDGKDRGPGIQHVGYLLEDAGAVEEAREHLKGQGLAIVEPEEWEDPTHKAEVYFLDPNGVGVNLFHRTSPSSSASS